MMNGIGYFILLGHLVLGNRFGAAETFSDQALAIIEEVETKFKVGACFQDAKIRASQTESYGDRNYAALWFSMYSRKCLISPDLLPSDKETNNFPFRLNKELRCQHTSYSDQETRSIFLKIANVLDRAVDVLGQKPYSETFRGVSTYLTLKDEKDSFVDESFVSVSIDINPALNFAKNQVLMIVKDYTGLEIENYAQEQFSYQNETLGKSVKVFNIERRVNDPREIASIMSQHKVNRERHPDNPAHILFIRQIQLTQQALEEMIKEQSKYSEGYCGVSGTSSASILRIKLFWTFSYCLMVVMMEI